MTTDFITTMPLMQHCGVTVGSATRDEVKGSMPWRTELCTTFGVLHGGALMAMADSLGAICAFLNLPANTMTSTIESKTNFFRPVTQGTVHGTTTPIHVGKTTIVVQTDLRDDAGKRVALVTQTQAVIQPKSGER
jgi:1,4-dihydroxy-2-naphthoyl-CoA hydrolase